LLFGPADLRYAKPERVADDRVIGTRRNNFGFQRRLPMGRWPDRDAVQVTLLLGPSHLIAARRELKDRIDLNRDGLLLGDLERVMGEIVGVVVLVEKPVRGAARMREQCVERLMLYLRIAGDLSGIVDEGRYLVAFNSRGHVR
jgi:hypothetical protein